MNAKKVLLTFIALFSISFLWKGGDCQVYAQDIHFSQSNMTPLMLNPALTGVFKGDQRASLSYKNQWGGLGVAGGVYRTAMFSFDTQLFTKKLRGGYLGAGVTAFKDVAGDLKLGTTQLNLSLAGVVFINDKQLLSGGIQGGFVQKSISNTGMQWNEQYDESIGAYNPSLPSNDVTSIPAYHYGDFSAGLAWGYNSKRSNLGANNQLKMNFGASASHINRPNQQLNPFSTSTSDNLHTKFIVHGSAQIGIPSTNYELVPFVVLYKQGKSSELDLGTMVRWTIQGESRYTGYVQGMALSLGVEYRNKDAFIPMALFEFANYAMGLSYDINNSPLTQGTHGRGGFEISLRYSNPNPFSRSSSRLLD
jgi:type IX secretion system PorP/SprF family membrane protein